MVFTRLGSRIFLQMCREGYGIAENVASIIMREFCSTIRKHLKPLMIPKLTKDKIKEVIVGFESLHGIPFSLGAIDGSHIPITPKVDPKSYYY
jgi:hypothetical protein